MNVIMPTAMSTMHQEKELRQSSSRTAKRGLCVLEALAGQQNSVKENAKAILDVASDQSEEESDASPALIKVCCVQYDLPSVSGVWTLTKHFCFVPFRSLFVDPFTSIGLISLKSGDMKKLKNLTFQNQ
jgi:hypothetical protein